MAQTQSLHRPPVRTVLEAYVNITAATYTAKAGDRVIGINRAGTVTVTLPTAEVRPGRIYTVKDESGAAATNNITVATEGAETIDGSATDVINVDYESKSYYSDGSNWFILPVTPDTNTQLTLAPTVSTQAHGDSAAAGSATTASKGDHKHGMPAAEGPGKLVLIGTIVAANDATITITGLDSTYDTYLIAIADMLPATDGAVLGLRMGDSGGIDSGATDYAYHGGVIAPDNSAYAGVANTGDAEIQITNNNIGNVAGEGGGAVLWLHRPGNGTTKPFISGTTAAFGSAGVLHGGHIVGHRTAVITLDRIQPLFSAGNITSGRMTIWGVAHA